MSLFSRRNLLAGISAFIIGIGAYAAIWGMPTFLTPGITTKSQVTAYLLDDRGTVNGLLLASGDQLHFSQQTGEAVTTQIKVGDELTATGRAGSKSNYGREVRVKQISANGRTIIEAKSGPKHSREPHGRRSSKGDGDRPAPIGATTQFTAKTEQSVVPDSVAGADKVENVAPALPETFKAVGTIKVHLVNGRGDVNGLILSTGEQIRFSPKVGQLIVAAEQGEDTPVSLEGTGVKTERGTVILPARITVGTQTIALGR